MKTDLFDHLRTLSMNDLWSLFNEAEELEESGVLSESSTTRDLSKIFLGEDSTLCMTLVGYCVYKVLACILRDSEKGPTQ